MHPETLSGLFVRQARRAGLPPIRLHDLRHSVASILLARDVHPKVVSELLGHATIALTLDTYSHVIPSLQQEAAGVVAAAVLDPAGMAPEPASTGQVRAIKRNRRFVQRGNPSGEAAGLGVPGGQGRDRTADLAVFSRVLLIRVRPGPSVRSACSLTSRAGSRSVIRTDPGPSGPVRIALAERWQKFR